MAATPGARMLVQHRHDGRLRLIAQHEHALLSGELAASWRGLDREPSPLSFEIVLATALHDLAWRELDEEPRRDEETGGPLGFHDFPLDERLAAYARGLDEAARIHPFVALLGSLHYTSFPDVAAVEEFALSEERRRRRLQAGLRLGREDEWMLGRQLGFLRMFDALSIFLCLAPPSATLEGQPGWVDGARHVEVPGGGAFHLTWVDDEVVHADPFPFRGTLELRLTYRELPAARFESQEALRAAWEAAEEEACWVELRSALRLA